MQLSRINIYYSKPLCILTDSRLNHLFLWLKMNIFVLTPSESCQESYNQKSCQSPRLTHADGELSM